MFKCVSGGKEGGFGQEVFGGLAGRGISHLETERFFPFQQVPKHARPSDADSYLAVPTSMEGILQRTPAARKGAPSSQLLLVTLLLWLPGCRAGCGGSCDVCNCDGHDVITGSA